MEQDDRRGLQSLEEIALPKESAGGGEAGIWLIIDTECRGVNERTETIMGGESLDRLVDHLTNVGRKLVVLQQR